MHGNLCHQGKQLRPFHKPEGGDRLVGDDDAHYRWKIHGEQREPFMGFADGSVMLAPPARQTTPQSSQHR